MLRLVPEPTNRFDHNAIEVVRLNGDQVGYLNRRLAEDVHGWMSKGEHWQAMVTDVTGVETHHDLHGLNLILLRSAQPQRAEQETVRKRPRRESSVA